MSKERKKEVILKQLNSKLLCASNGGHSPQLVITGSKLPLELHKSKH